MLTMDCQPENVLHLCTATGGNGFVYWVFNKKLFILWRKQTVGVFDINLAADCNRSNSMGNKAGERHWICCTFPEFLCRPLPQCEAGGGGDIELGDGPLSA